MWTHSHLYVGSPGGVCSPGLEEQINSFCMMPADSSKASQNHDCLRPIPVIQTLLPLKSQLSQEVCQ